MQDGGLLVSEKGDFK